MIKKHVVRLFYLSPLLCLSFTDVRAQSGLYITSGSYIVMSGSSNLVLTNCHLHQDGTFTPGAGTVKFTGSSQNTEISGSSITFHNLTIDEPTNDVVLLNDIAVGADLNMVNRHIQLNNSNIDLGTTGNIIGEDNSSYITGPAGGMVLRTETLNAPVSANPGNIGIELTTTGNLGTTLVRRGHIPQTGTTSGIGIGRYFDIIPAAGNAGLNASLDFHYLDHEIVGFTEADLAMSARDVPMGYWDMIGVDALDQANNILTKNSIDTLGRFTLTSSTNDPLPITLLAFYGSLQNRQALLNWEVANELSIMKYDLERSADGLSFTGLTTVKAHGTQSTNFKYSYVDPAPFKGSTYYRLRLYDKMEKSTYSKTIRVDMNEAFTLSVYPNPVVDKVNVEFNCTELTTMHFQLLDAQGRVIAIKEVKPVPCANKVEWNVSSLPSATYYLKLTGLSDTPVKISKF